MFLSKVWVLVGHLGLLDLLQPAGDALALVQLGEDRVHAALAAGLGGGLGVENVVKQVGGRRRRRRRRRGGAGCGSRRRRRDGGGSSRPVQCLFEVPRPSPRNARSLVLLDVGLQRVEDAQEALHPFRAHLLALLALVVLQDSVRPELRRVLEVRDVRHRSRGDDPAQNSNTLRHGVEEVEVFALSVVILDLDHLHDQLVHWGDHQFLELGVVDRNLLRLAGRIQNRPLLLDSLLKGLRLLSQNRINLLRRLHVRQNFLFNEGIKLLDGFCNLSIGCWRCSCRGRSCSCSCSRCNCRRSSGSWVQWTLWLDVLRSRTAQNVVLLVNCNVLQPGGCRF